METYRDQMQRDMVLRNLSPKTQYLYHHAARGLEEHFNKSPDQLDENDVKSFLHSHEAPPAYPQQGRDTEHFQRYGYAQTKGDADGDLFRRTSGKRNGTA